MPQTKKSTAKSQESSQSTPRFPVSQQVVDFQKRLLRNQHAVFESTFKAVTSLQDRQYEVVHGALEQATFVPSEVKELAGVWADSRRSARDSYKQTVDKSFVLVENWIDGLAGSTA